MGGFSNWAPVIAGAVQTGAEIANNREQTRRTASQIDAQRDSQQQALAAEKAADDERRARQLRALQASLRARQGASGLAAGAAGSAGAVLSGAAQSLLDVQDAANGAYARQSSSIDQNAQYRRQSLLDTSRYNTLSQISSWFARRDNWGN
ncbi:hypothetical protein [Thalassospira marina]|uniref:Uncharacterized protein n=1 Tax=Thalassospira marina TaxID=2048283 RepID=A0A2N3KZP9_9PROT|nr:hypothetical protein [Thalassospira marina]PKR56042.1 hypothetical protein COO20_02195 [Thalassospira marina]